MAEKSRSLNFILLICALIGAAWFYGCSGGASSDPIPVPVMQISGTVYSQDNLGNIAYDGNLLPDLRAQFAAPGVTVHLASDESKQTVTDKDGKFVLIGVNPGTYQIVARFKVSESLTYKVLSAPITVSEQKAEASIPQLDLKKASTRVYGIVRKADGSVFPNARMTLWGETFYSEPDGTFKSPPMYDNAEDTIYIDSPGYQKAALSVKFADNAPFIDQMVVTNAATNRAPTASLSATRYTVDKLYEVNLTGIGTDLDDNIATYTWSKTSGTFTADISNPLKRAWFAPNSDTLATLTFTVIDSEGLKSAASVMITVGRGQVVPNNPPTVSQIAISPADISVARYYELSVVATDTDKDILTYTWSVTSASGKPGSLQSTNTAKVTWISPDLSASADVVIKVVVNDRKENGSIERTLTVPVAATLPNRAPQISSIDISSTPVYGYTEYTLTANASDPDNDPVTYLWTASGTIVDPQKMETVWKTPVVIATDTYEVTLVVTDSKGAASTHKANYEIRPTDIVPPVVSITAPADNHTYRAGMPVAFTGEATASGGVKINEARFTWYEREDAGAYALLKSGQSA
ncbi:MAG: hypothetical protein PHD82_16020, partial [Candidatus Riflebacteria bacterium]|nr:hypothetical protein [Candidatus Riflebacteria bacterium]